MYQSEVTPEMDKLNKTINQSSSCSSSQTDVQSLETNGTATVGSSQSASSVVMATTHVDELPHPSEVLIDLKVCITTLHLVIFLSPSNTTEVNLE